MATDDTSDGDVPDDVFQELYSVAPADFLARRTSLVKRLRADGAADLARQVTSLRKPTLPASIVNRLVHADETVVPRLAELGDSMRAAQDDLDVTLLRQLSESRRRLVAELVTAAADEIGENPSPAVRDEVGATLEAAVADPDVLATLGHLVRPQRWSGFGLPATSGPTLTLVAGTGTGRRDTGRRTPVKPRAGHPDGRAGGKADEAAEPVEEKAAPPPPKRTARMLARAQTTFDEAEAALAGADEAEAAARDQVSNLSDRLAEVTAQLERARRDHEAARREARAARTRRREARSALDRALRNAES